MEHGLQILFKALVDSFRPRMLMLTLVSVAAAAIFWVVLIWLSTDPLANLAISLLGHIGIDVSQSATDSFALVGWLKAFLVPMAVFGFMWPIVASSAVLLAGLYVTPPVLNYLGQREYSSLKKQGEGTLLMGLWVTLRAVVIFLVGWIITFPLWLIPGMAFVLPLLWTAYLLIAVMRFDALSAHATKAELKLIKKKDSSTPWLIGVVCAFLSFVPPILLIMPVMSALAFTRYYLGALENIRNNTVVDTQ